MEKPDSGDIKHAFTNDGAVIVVSKRVIHVSARL